MVLLYSMNVRYEVKKWREKVRKKNRLKSKVVTVYFWINTLFCIRYFGTDGAIVLLWKSVVLFPLLVNG